MTHFGSGIQQRIDGPNTKQTILWFAAPVHHIFGSCLLIKTLDKHGIYFDKFSEVAV